ncbi:MAG: CBS domain-containing protein [Bryobacteraceae bacterium]|nr:CBS domain-containing protein [Bryobacteraceae bacterium]
MTQSPAVVTGDTDLKKVAQLMAECDCGAIPVVESKTNRRPIGVITDRDIVIRTIAEGKDPMDCTARDCMTEDVISVRPEATVDQVIEKMENNQVRRVLVVDRNGKCQGIISQGDIARYAPKREAGELVREVSKPSGILARSR